MKIGTDDTINSGFIVGVVDEKAIVGGVPLGIVTAFRESSPPSVFVPEHTSASVTLCTTGECSVIAGGAVSAGDFFTADADGKAVATTSGFALGRILEAGSADEIVLCAISPTSL